MLQQQSTQRAALKRTKVFLGTVAAMTVLGTSTAAHAHSNLLPAIKVGSGWVSVVSYINTQAAPSGGSVFIHATHQSKSPTNLTSACTHLDGRSPTTRNDLTTSVLTTPGGAVGSVFPSGDTVGGAIINPAVLPAIPASEGFLILENYDSAGVLGADGTLTSEAIVFNLSSGFLFSDRALTVSHTAASPTGTVLIDAPGCGLCNYIVGTPAAYAYGVADNGTAGTLTRFMFLPPATATTGAYVIAANRLGVNAEASEAGTTTNLVAAGYNARIRLEARMDATQGYALGVYNRLEDFRSLTQVNDVVCLAQLSPDQLTGGAVPTFITNGGWMNLAPRCRETEDGGTTFITCDADAAGVQHGDAAMLYKTEFATGYGFAATPMNQQWYAK